MSPAPLSYRLAVRAARLAAPLLGRHRSKLGRGMAARRGAHARLEAWAREARDPARPLAWFHAPSVGEGLQARAVMEALRALRPDLQVAFTHFSPSAEPLARRFGADVADYLPWDARDLLGPVLERLAPDVVVFTKTEVWPVLVEEAGRRGTPAALVAGTVPPGAGRRSRPARLLLGPTWRRLDAALACTDDDARALVEIGVRAEVVHVTGDPGIDSAARRAVAADPAAPHLAVWAADAPDGDGGPAPLIVLGSTWPSDERVLLPALDGVRRRVPNLRVVIAPHEPSGDRVGALIGALMQQGWHPATLAHVEAAGGLGPVDAVVVERVGVLAELYTVGSVAYVGGGFHGAGLHSVLEPAAAGVPVLFGPRHGNARAAADLLARGGGASVHTAAEAAEALARWLADSSAKSYAAGQARGYIEEHMGAADRTARHLASLLQARGPR